MSEWTKESLGSLVTFQKGRKVETSDFQKAGFASYLGAGSLTGENDNYADPAFAIKANENDILMLWDGERSGLVGHKLNGVVSSTVSKLTPNTKIGSDYLYYYLLFNFDWIQGRRTGTGVPHVPKDLARILEVSYPECKGVQFKISSILSAIDRAIEKTESLIAKYQKIKSGLMHDLFTRGVTADGKLRPPREQAPELYQETAIGWIPNEWEVSVLAAKARAGTSWIRTGPFGSSLKGEHWKEYGHPVITIGSLGEGDFIEEWLLFVNGKDAARLRDFQLRPGDVVFSRVADVGRSTVVRDEQAGWIMSSNLMRIAIDAVLARPDYLQMQLAGDARVKSQIRARVNSGGRDVANSEVLSQLRFVWPDLDEQDRIIALSGRVTRWLNIELRKAEKLRCQKLGLMQDLLTGKVPVKIDEQVVEARSD